MINLLYLIPLIALTILATRKQDMRMSQAITLVGTFFAMLLNIHEGKNIIPIVIVLMASEIINILIIGWLANKTFIQNYQAILYASALFPFYHSLKNSIIYISLIIFLLILLHTIKLYQASKQYGLKTLNKKTLQSKLSPSNYTDYLTYRHIKLLSPLLLASLVTFIMSFL